MSLPAKLRLFVAVDVPGDVLEHLDAITEPLKPMIEGARWTTPAGRHVTLKFLGWTPQELFDDLVQTIARCADHAPAPIRVSGLGAFPTTRRARVVWAGIDDPSELLSRMVDDLERALQPLGFEAEARSFSPHLTLARLKVPRPIDRALSSAPDLDSRAFQVSSLSLYRTHLHPKGASYERLREFRLGAVV